MFENALYYEIDNTDLKKYGKKACIESGLYMVWTEDRITGAFNFGKGTKKDFVRYAMDNRKYCTIISARDLEKVQL